jgi:hypothetical protein
VSRAAQTHEFGDRLEVLAKHELVALDHDRDLAHPELEEPFEALTIVRTLTVTKSRPSAKKLLRAKTAASARLGVEDELVDDSIHGAGDRCPSRSSYSKRMLSVQNQIGAAKCDSAVSGLLISSRCR